MTNAVTKGMESNPAASGHLCVRGFNRSKLRSARRLNAMAADRALTIATRIHTSWYGVITPSPATRALIKAKGSAKIECSILIIRSVRRSLPAKPVMRSILTPTTTDLVWKSELIEHTSDNEIDQFTNLQR